ncbi:hypothetical protein B0H12DRAFT_1125693, partial [Mycena haematopus]
MRTPPAARSISAMPPWTTSPSRQPRTMASRRKHRLAQRQAAHHRGWRQRPLSRGIVGGHRGSTLRASGWQVTVRKFDSTIYSEIFDVILSEHLDLADAPHRAHDLRARHP